jgi:hypothetical protein
LIANGLLKPRFMFSACNVRLFHWDSLAVILAGYRGLLFVAWLVSPLLRLNAACSPTACALHVAHPFPLGLMGLQQPCRSALCSSERFVIVGCESLCTAEQRRHGCQRRVRRAQQQGPLLFPVADVRVIGVLADLPLSGLACRCCVGGA